MNLQERIDALEPDKTKRYDTLYAALLKYDDDFRFMNEVMGREWVEQNYNYGQLHELWMNDHMVKRLMQLGEYINPK